MTQPPSVHSGQPSWPAMPPAPDRIAPQPPAWPATPLPDYLARASGGSRESVTGAWTTATAGPPGVPSYRPSGEFKLVWVRRRDVRRLRRYGPPTVYLPPVHAATSDPRYPSPRYLRSIVGVVLDLVVHLALAAGAAFAGYERTAGSSRAATAVAVGLLALLAVSIIDRICIQAITGTTSGKAMVGICTIRDDTGDWPPPWSLVTRWLGSVIRPVVWLVLLCNI